MKKADSRSMSPEFRKTAKVSFKKVEAEKPDSDPDNGPNEDEEKPRPSMSPGSR